ncbi:MAG: TorF family putative porin [Verrucomicrobiota bacterium]|nr:TorF family putative porin [Verrucomicrobiota bacterium]
MKKITTIALLSVLATTAYAQEDKLAVSASFAWENEYIFRGLQLSNSAFQPAIDLSYGGAYVGMWTSLPVESAEANSKEIDIYGGYGAKVGDMVNVDAGATIYYYPSKRDVSATAYKNTVEAYLGGSLDVILKPSLYVYYDFKLESVTLESSIGHSIDLGDNLGIDTGLAVGYVWAEKIKTGLNNAPDRLYGQATADLTYAFTDSAKFKIGARLSANDYSQADLTYIGNANGDRNLWWGASFTAGF